MTTATENPYATPETPSEFFVPSREVEIALRRRLVLLNLALFLIYIAVQAALESTLPSSLLTYKQAEAAHPLSRLQLVVALAALGYLLLWLFSLWTVWADKPYSFPLFLSVSASGILLQIAGGPSVSPALASTVETAAAMAEGGLLLHVFLFRPGTSHPSA